MSSTAARRDRIFRALADPSRRAILDRLTDGEANVAELVAAGRVTQSAVSQQLRILRDAGLVQQRRSGRNNYYTLRAAALLPVRDWLSHYERFWADNLDRLGAVLRARHGQGN
jgi:DNA-binding transcriptional ArsR family regulator